jgi:uncharacterized delta-60 repeat protein
MQSRLGTRRLVAAALVPTVIFTALTIGSAPAGAAPDAGDLDVTFNGTGVAETQVVNDLSASDIARAPDGRLLAVVDGDVWRFDADGTLDTTFGREGVLDVTTTPALFPNQIAVLPDGRFVLGGSIAGGVGAARFSADGTFDPTFGVPFIPADLIGSLRQVLVQSSGHVVLVGPPGGLLSEVFGVARFAPNGLLADASIIRPPDGESPSSFEPFDAALASGDRVVIAVGAQVEDGVAAVRLEADLDIDPTFSGDGISLIPDNANDVFTVDGFHVAVRSDDSVGIVAGQLGDLNGVWLYRWAPDGDFVGRDGVGFGAAIDQTSSAGLAVTSDDEFLATMTTIDTDPNGQVRSLAAVRLDASGDEVARTTVERDGIRLTATAATGGTLAGEFEGTDGRLLFVAQVSDEPEADPEFGDDGVVSFEGGGSDQGQAVAVLPDGGVVVGGTFSACEGSFGFVLRHEADGSLDRGFGGNQSSCARFSKPGVVHFNHPVRGVAVDAEGRILVVGDEFTDDGRFVGIVARLLPDGTPDPEFNDGDPVEIPSALGVSAFPLRLNGVTVDDEDRIVVVGTQDGNSDQPFQEFAVGRLLADGSFDDSFNGGRLSLFAFGNVAEGRAVAVDADGRIVVVGSRIGATSQGPCCTTMVIARLGDDGTLDPDFGDRGLVVEDNGATLDRGFAVDVRPDGRIVAAGLAVDASEVTFATVVQLLATGQRDAAFAEGGLFTTQGELAASGNGVVIDELGNVVVAGATFGPDGDVFVQRLTPGGAPDSGFGSGGLVRTDLGGTEQAAGVALAPNGRIVIGGSSADARGTRVLAARYHAVTIPDPVDPPPPPPPPAPQVFTPTISLNPAVGRAGSLTTVTGAGFPAGAAVSFDWSIGIDSVGPVTVGGDGTFTASVLVFPSEIVGQRTLVATTAHPDTGGPLTASSPYLVSVGTAQPGDFVSRR